MRSKVIVLTIVVAVTLIALLNLPKKEAGLGLSPIGSLNLSSSTPATTISNGDKNEYQNEKYGFALSLDQNLSVKEFNESGGATTIVFQDIQNSRGFQIFIVPYDKQQITEDRFLTDIPSGVRLNPLTGYLDGVLVTSFYSQNLLLGETFEVWFIHNNFLYEVTTLKNLDRWLLDIMDTWRFM